MLICCGRKRISATDRAAHASTQPTLEFPPLGCDTKMVCRQAEARDVSFDKGTRFLVIDQPAHDADLPGRACLRHGDSVPDVANICGAESS